MNYIKKIEINEKTKKIEILLDNNKKLFFPIISSASPYKQKEKIVGTELLFDIKFPYKKMRIGEKEEYLFTYNNKIIKHKGDLLNILKETKQLSKLTKIHLENAKEESKKLKKDFYFSINIDEEELESQEFFEYLLKTSKTNPDFFKQIKFELLEVDNIDLKKPQVIKFLSFIHHIGATIAQDDFNKDLITNSRIIDLINTLKNLPVGEIKKNKEDTYIYAYKYNENNEIIKRNQSKKLHIKIDETIINSLVIENCKEVIKEYENNKDNISEELNYDYKTSLEVYNEVYFRKNPNIKEALYNTTNYKDFLKRLKPPKPKYFENNEKLYNLLNTNDFKSTLFLIKYEKEDNNDNSLKDLVQIIEKEKIELLLTTEWITNGNIHYIISKMLKKYTKNINFNLDELIIQGDTVIHYLNNPICNSEEEEKTILEFIKKEEQNNLEKFEIFFQLFINTDILTKEQKVILEKRKVFLYKQFLEDFYDTINTPEMREEKIYKKQIYNKNEK